MLSRKNKILHMEEKIEKFRKGIFNLQTRRFGTFAEIMIRTKFNLKKSGKKEYDAVDEDGNHIEIKFARVIRKSNKTIDESTVIDVVENEPTLFENALSSTDTTNKFSPNIEQVKPEKFNYLYYGLFFTDYIYIYFISSKEIEEINYTNTMHAVEPVPGQIEEGQFHIDNTNIKLHEKYRLKDKTMTYEDLYNLLNEQAERLKAAKAAKKNRKK